MTQPPSPDAIASALRELLPDARAAWLFGSAAKGHWQPGSDLDIAVGLSRAWATTERLSVAERLTARFGMDVDLLDFHRLHTVMQVQIIGTGRLLFSLDPVQLTQYQGFLHTEYQHMQRWRQPMIKQLAQRLLTQDATP